MARRGPTATLVRLKLRLLRAGVELAGVRGVVAFVVTFLLAAGFGLLGGVLFALLRGVDAPLAGDVTRLVFTGLFVAWALSPVLLLASENTLEVDRLALFPLGPRQMMPGLLIGSVVGFGGLATIVCLAGGVVGMAPPSGLAVLTVAAFVVHLLVCVAAGRVVSTWLSALARTRRWRDVALSAAPVLALAVSFSGQFVSLMAGPEPGGTVERLSGTTRLILSLLPSGPTGSAVAAAREGRAVDAVGSLVVGVVVLAALVWLWWRAVTRVLTTAAESSASRPAAAAGGAAGGGLFPRVARWLPRNRVGAVAAKELRMLVRDPRQRQPLIVGALSAVFPLFSMSTSGRPSGEFMLFAAMPALVYGAQAVNLYGFDGPRFWVHVAAGDDARSDLAGKNVAVAATAGAAVLAVSLALGAVTGGWERLPAVWGLAAVVLGLPLGLGNVLSVSSPVPMPESTTNVWAQNPSQGLQMMGPAVLSMLVTLVGAAPFVVAHFVLPETVAWTVALFAVQVAVAVGAWRIGFGIAVSRSAARQAEILAKLEPRRAA